MCKECGLGQRELYLPGAQDALDVLDFGKPVLRGGVDGTGIFSFSFATTSQIAFAADQCGQGYWECVGSDCGSQLRLAMGTSSYGSQVTYNHGADWVS